MSDNNLVTVTEMAKQLNCHPDTVRRMLRNGEIPRVKVRNTYRMDPEKVILALSQEEDE